MKNISNQTLVGRGGRRGQNPLGPPGSYSPDNCIPTNPKLGNVEILAPSSLDQLLTREDLVTTELKPELNRNDW